MVITADHGVSFRPGDYRRIPHANELCARYHGNPALSSKRPFSNKREKRATIGVEIIDILPSIADLLGIDPPRGCGRTFSIFKPAFHGPEHRSRNLFLRLWPFTEKKHMRDPACGRETVRSFSAQYPGSNTQKPQLRALVVQGHPSRAHERGCASGNHYRAVGSISLRLDPEAQFLPAHITGTLH